MKKCNICDNNIVAVSRRVLIAPKKYRSESIYGYGFCEECQIMFSSFTINWNTEINYPMLIKRVIELQKEAVEKYGTEDRRWRHILKECEGEKIRQQRLAYDILSAVNIILREMRND